MRRRILDRVAKGNDVAYSWPDQTCVKIVIDYARIILQRDIILPSIFELSEARANAVIRKAHSGSWFDLLRHHVSLYNYGHKLPATDDLQTGDIVEFEGTHFICRGARTGIGIMYDDDWLYAKGDSHVLPIPVQFSVILSAVRLSICPQ